MKKTVLRDINISKLIMLKRNPQYLTPKQMDSLMLSIKRDGFCVPILVRPISAGRYEVVSGNHRFMAGKKLGLKVIPCVVSKITNDDCKRLAVNLNTIHGEPNVELLAPFLADMSDDILGQIHFEDGVLEELVEFDRHLADRLKELEPPDTINRDSSSAKNAKSGTCKCPRCGKIHLKP